jgi:uncharacterized OB-fold protein
MVNGEGMAFDIKAVQGDIIPIACKNCGHPCSFVPARPGEYSVGCSNCGRKTTVTVYKDGSLYTR